MNQPAKTLSCPMCGAPASTEEPLCSHCGARLATVGCPSCFGMMFQGSKFCPHCGARAARIIIDSEKTGNCPRCRTRLELAKIGETELRECPKCAGVWVDTASLERICAEKDRQAAVVALTQQGPSVADITEDKIRYLPCPDCKRLMNRINFAGCSNVIVDVCKSHGTWFDRDELRRIVEFIRSGGLDQARRREVADLEQRQRQLKAALSDRGNANSFEAETRADRHSGIEFLAGALSAILKDWPGE